MTQPLPEHLRKILIGVALGSIHHGLAQGRPLEVRPTDYPEPLQAERATFVTLERDGGLRGCIGHLEPLQSLVADVAENAFAAAFRDPRFPPLETPELEGLELHISVLSPATPMTFSSEEDLIRQLRPGVDGLILQDGYRRGTFLPSVWEQLPDPAAFLRHLKLKAGLPQGHWSSRLQVARYETESFGA
jgi:uncharacterized protein